ncbi:MULTISPECIES: ABC transporter permease [Micromonospora]|uniref:ABC transporter permease n=1 Tax=Micromonospora chalcea TaxID=1874 RepID=A0ABX9XYP5_MICCH|nr:MULTISPECIES: ABC transporter permease [Micromonospora]EWM64297.1 oligopeptide ABC transporter permease [Micromonospora sp. M42]MBC8991733.1 ABC transporter permease [Micromonospora chalcea]MBP1782825.1 peptide/nickel transport system permease protein [Micromonospora sp. HB375]MBQ1061931.1 ABC transporter permease [Micromonospora sp. C41]MBQ1068338.1 ABC transporter permease [Micromonospora sp. D75]
MIRYASRRLLAAIPLLFVVPLLVFALIELAPGDPAVVLAGDEPTPERVEAIREELNLNAPVLVRYAMWVGDVLRGDLGTSFLSDQTVIELLTRRMATTMSLVLVAMIFAVVLGATLALVATLRSGGIVDRFVNGLASIAIAIPGFWFGLVLASVFAVGLQMFPAFGYQPLADGFWPWLSHLVLPGIALGLLPAAEVTLQLRSALGQVMKSDYVLNAEAKGLSRSSVVFKHSLKNACIPVVTVLGFRVAEVLAGSVTIEMIYNMPGLGRTAIEAVQGRDIPVLLGFVLFSTTVVVLVNLIVDISYGYFNPKVRS